MGVDLGVGAHSRRGQPERRHGPAQILVPLRAAKREALAEGGLIHLDDRRARRLQIEHLVPHRQRELEARVGTRLVVAHKAPLEHGDRSCEHPLHGQLRAGACRLPPADGDRIGPADVSEQDRRLYVARSIGLHPSVAGEGVALEALGKVLHHVVPLELPVNENVEAGVLLHLDASLDLGLDEPYVRIAVQLSTAKGEPPLSDLRVLREGADRRGREGGEPEAFLLSDASLREGLLATRGKGVDAAQPLPDGRVAGAG